MIKVFSLIAFLAAVGAAVNANTFKIDTAALAGKIRHLEAQIAEEEDRIILLKAEWNFLTQPQRVQNLADQHLALLVVNTEQLVTMAEIARIPMRKAEDDGAEGSDPIAAILEEALSAGNE